MASVSIVVPIYNMEAYLARCLDSLLAQTCTDLEIIAVNDGSQDASLSILECYARRDSRIVVLDRENGGVSAARNVGIQAARGKYIGFVDPDDWVDESMYGDMYEQAVQEDADIVMCAYVREYGTHAKEKGFQLPDKSVYRDEELQKNMTRRLVGPLGEELANPEYLDAWGTVWSKIYRAELIKANNLQFVDLSVVGSNEDSLFNIHAFYRARSFVFLNRPFYHYWRANAASITSAYNPSLESKFGKLYAHMEALLHEHDLQDEYRLALNNRICMNIVGLGLNIVGQRNGASALLKIRELKRLLANPRIQRSFVRFETKYSPVVWKVFFHCARWKFATGVYLMLEAMNWIRVRNMRSVQGGTGKNSAGSNRDEPRRLGNDDHELLPADGSKQNTV